MKNNMSRNNNNFVERPFQMVAGGEYDEMGFYYTPDGSFWDPDGVYFNREGLDKHGGYYDDQLEYHPGPGWIEELMCYEDEKEQILRSRTGRGRKIHRNNAADFDDDFDDAEEIDIDELYEEVDYNKVLQEEERRYREPQRSHGGHGGHSMGNPGNVNINNGNLNYTHQPHPHPHHYMDNLNNSSNLNNLNNIPSTHTQNPITTTTSFENENKKFEISPELIFNKIPENLKPQTAVNSNSSNNVSNTANSNTTSGRTEKHIEVDSLFG